MTAELARFILETFFVFGLCMCVPICIAFYKYWKTTDDIYRRYQKTERDK